MAPRRPRSSTLLVAVLEPGQALGGVIVGGRVNHKVRPTLTALGGVYAPKYRDRTVSTTLRVYAAMTSSSDHGAVRDVTKLR
jgi:hypothetical protein